MAGQIPISIALPCFGRPQRTRRILENLAAQTLTGFELLIVNDGCTTLKELFGSPWFIDWRQRFVCGGNFLYLHQFSHNMGSFGAYAIHHCAMRARGSYFCFANNDDVLLPDHARFYFSSIDGSRCDWQYFPTMLVSDGMLSERIPALAYGGIGHSEIVVNTWLIKSIMSNRDFSSLYVGGYGHDWALIQQLRPHPHGPGHAPWPTYYIMGFGQERERDID